MAEDREVSTDCQNPSCELCGSKMVWKCSEGCDDIDVLSYTALLTGRMERGKRLSNPRSLLSVKMIKDLSHLPPPRLLTNAAKERI
jgi:hypothetical protein